jgi:hypothetical protein
MEETGQGKEPDAFPTDTAGNGSKQPSPEEEQSLVTRPKADEGNGQHSNRKYTGPQTREEKISASTMRSVTAYFPKSLCFGASRATNTSRSWRD